jgi:hypothetical protein
MGTAVEYPVLTAVFESGDLPDSDFLAGLRVPELPQGTRISSSCGYRTSAGTQTVPPVGT